MEPSERESAESPIKSYTYLRKHNGLQPRVLFPCLLERIDQGVKLGRRAEVVFDELEVLVRPSILLILLLRRGKIAVRRWRATTIPFDTWRRLKVFTIIVSLVLATV